MGHLRPLPRHRHSRWLAGHQRPVAQGVFPVCEFTHVLSGPQKSLAITCPLAEAGFIVPASPFSNLCGQDVYTGDQSKDVSGVITRTFALNTADAPLAGHINTAVGVGASGHFMGGMTTHGLLTSWPDARITAAIPMSCVDMGNPSQAVRAKVLFKRGDRDGTCPISSTRPAYRELPVAKAFLTFRGAGDSNYFGGSRAVDTFVDWMRWNLCGDTGTRDRLRADATSSTTTWESALN
ncbi:alpha/beta hydrolase [Streptomyces luteogriseus]|uniref:alpha/beta hydrolase n=1 Tax=Streptomyces luteogriseus TaxID=68233 RepID=UPI00379F02C5